MSPSVVALLIVTGAYLLFTVWNVWDSQRTRRQP